LLAHPAGRIAQLLRGNERKPHVIDVAQLLHHLRGVCPVNSRRRDCRVHIFSLPIIEQVERTRHARRAFPSHVRVDHGRVQAPMAEQDLNRSQVDAALDEVGRETVTKGVAMDCLAQARRTPCLSDRSLERGRVNMMAAQAARSRTARQLPRGESELPAQFLGRPRILPLQRLGQVHAGYTACHVALVQLPPPGQLAFQIGTHRAR
jgi:hypothetical protein